MLGVTVPPRRMTAHEDPTSLEAASHGSSKLQQASTTVLDDSNDGLSDLARDMAAVRRRAGRKRQGSTLTSTAAVIPRSNNHELGSRSSKLSRNQDASSATIVASRTVSRAVSVTHGAVERFRSGLAARKRSRDITGYT